MVEEKQEKEGKEDYQGLNPEELDDDEKELLKEEEEKKKAPKKKPKKEEVVKKRYAVFTQPARGGITDTETGEVIGEGETMTAEVLAEILERLERIETNLGSMMGGE